MSRKSIEAPELMQLELIQSHMAQKPVLRGEVGCACVAREVSIEALCAASPEALAHSPSQMPLSCPPTCFKTQPCLPCSTPRACCAARGSLGCSSSSRHSAPPFAVAVPPLVVRLVRHPLKPSPLSSHPRFHLLYLWQNVPNSLMATSPHFSRNSKTSTHTLAPSSTTSVATGGTSRADPRPL